MRILLIANQSLLGDVLENLLSSLSVTCVSRLNKTDADSLLQNVALFQPDIIVLDEDAVDEYPVKLLSQLLHKGHARLILTNHQENRVHVYDKFSTTLSQAADLLALTVPNHRTAKTLRKNYI